MRRKPACPDRPVWLMHSTSTDAESSAGVAFQPQCRHSASNVTPASGCSAIRCITYRMAALTLTAHPYGSARWLRRLGRSVPLTGYSAGACSQDTSGSRTHTEASAKPNSAPGPRLRGQGRSSAPGARRRRRAFRKDERETAGPHCCPDDQPLRSSVPCCRSPWPPSSAGHDRASSLFPVPAKSRCGYLRSDPAFRHRPARIARILRTYQRRDSHLAGP